MTHRTRSRLLRRATTLLMITPLIGVITGCGATPESQDTVDTASLALNISNFKGWQGPIGTGVLTSAPSANFLGQFNDKIDLFARGTDNALWHERGQTSDNGLHWTWAQNWDSFGMPSVGGVNYPLLGKGASTTWAAVRSIGTAVAVRALVGGQAQAFVKFGFGGSFGSWSQVSNGNLERDPAMAFNFPYLYVFAPGTDHQLYFSRNDISTNYNPANWTAWQNIPGAIVTSEPGAAAAGGKLFVAVRNTNNKYSFIQSTNNGAWSAWTAGPSAANTFDSGPALTATDSSGGTTLNIFGTESSSNGVHTMLNSTSTNGGATWGAYQSTGGNLLAGPAAIAASPTHIETFGLATNNTIYQDTYLE